MQTLQETLPPSAGLSLPTWAALALQWFITLALPAVLILLTARLAMTEAYMRWAYTQPSFPPDPYGFSLEDRLHYGPVALDYLFGPDADLLARQTFPDGEPLFNERELSHMRDVRTVTRGLSVFGWGLVALTAAAGLTLALSPAARPHLWRAGLAGGLLTLALIAAGGLLVATSFNWLFTQFHNLFFAEGTWLFPTSDTLIRLYPLPFWSTAFALVFGGAALGAVIAAGLGWLMLRRP